MQPVKTYRCLDIETLGTSDPAEIELIKAGMKAPSNYKDPQKIAEYIEGNLSEKIAQTSFNSGLGRVLSVSWAKGLTAAPTVAYAEHADQEGDIIREFFADFDEYHSEILAAHYAIFDLQFITNRSVALGIPLPPVTSWPRDIVPWSKGVLCTQTAWAGRRDKVSLKNLCHYLGIEGAKDDISGADVGPLFHKGEHARIKAYAAQDVKLVQAVVSKYEKAGF